MYPLPRLRAIRTGIPMSMRELAKASGVALSTVEAIEHGRQSARPSTVRALARALNVTPQHLMAKGDDGGSR